MDFAQPKIPVDQVDVVAQPASAQNTFVAPDYVGRLKQGERYWSTMRSTPDTAGRSVIAVDYDDAAVLKAPNVAG